MPKRPSPFEGEGQEGEVRHPQPVMLSVAKHPRNGFLTAFGMTSSVMLNRAQAQ